MCTESGCGTKLQNKSGQTILRFAKFDLLARIKAYWQTPGIAKDLLYVTTRQRGDGDVFDGDLLRSRDPQDLVNKVLLSLTGDSTVIQTFRNKSYTPLVLRYLNLPPHLRHTHQGLMVWAILPPKVPDTTKILEFLLRDIIDRTGPSMEFVVREYRRDRHSRYADRTLQIEFHRLLEDSRGLHKSIMSKQTPAYIGGCPFCQVKGVKGNVKNSTFYPCAVTHLPVNDELREEFAGIFRNWKLTKNKANRKRKKTADNAGAQSQSQTSQPRPTLPDDRFDFVKELGRQAATPQMTKQLAYDAGMRVETNPSEASVKKEPFKGTDAFTKVLTLQMFDRVKSSVVDPAHCLKHFTTNMYALLGSRGNMAFTEPRHDFEKTTLGRFTEFKTSEPPWKVSAKRRKQINDLVVNSQLRVPEGWPALRPLFDGVETSWKIAEGLAHIGPRGLYFLSLMDCDDKYRQLFIDSILAIARILLKVPPTLQSRVQYQKEIVRVVARQEVMLPTYWLTITNHFMLEAMSRLKLHGSFWSTNMLAEERLHTKLRKWCTSTKHPLTSMAEKCQLHTESIFWRFQRPPSDANDDLDEQVPPFTHPPKASSFSGAKPQKTPSKDIKCSLKIKQLQLDDPTFGTVKLAWQFKDEEFHDLIRRFLRSSSSSSSSSRSLAQFAGTNSRPLTPRQSLLKHMNNVVRTFSKVTLDGVTFRTVDSQRFLKQDNSWIGCEYHHSETGTRTRNSVVKTAYGRIQRIFEHRMYPSESDDAPKGVFVECDWYMEESKDPITGLVKVKRNRAWDENQRVAFVEDCKPVNFVVWPADPFATAEDEEVENSDKDPFDADDTVGVVIWDNANSES